MYIQNDVTLRLIYKYHVVIYKYYTPFYFSNLCHLSLTSALSVTAPGMPLK